MNIKKSVLLFLISLSCFSLLFGVIREARSDLTDLAMGVRSLGMGGAFTALNSETDSIFANPAAIYDVHELSIQTTWFSLLENINYKILGIVLPPLFPVHVGIGFVSNMTDGFINTTIDQGRVRSVNNFMAGDTALVGAMGTIMDVMGHRITLGLNIKYYTQNSEHDARSAWGCDIGWQTLWEDSEQWTGKTGMALKNFLEPVFYANDYFTDKEYIAKKLCIGASLFSKKYQTLIQIDFQGDTLYSGVEYTIDPGVFLRAGLSQKQLSCGVGLVMLQESTQRIGIDYTYQQSMWEESPSHLLSLNYVSKKGPQSLDIKEVGESLVSSVTLNDHDFLYIDIPEDKTVTTKEVIWVKGHTKETLETLWIQNQSVEISKKDYTFEVPIPLKKFGKNIILIQGSDSQKNVQRVTLRIFRTASFVDVVSKNKQTEAINKMAELNLFGGYKDQSFHPEKPLTRAELAALLSKITQSPLSHPTEKLFRDVPLDYWATPYIELMIKEKIMEPINNEFRPGSPVSHAEAVKIIAKFDHLIPPSLVTIRAFNDVPLQSATSPWAEIIKKSGILSDEPLLHPTAPLTRGEAALWLFRTERVKSLLVDLMDWEKMDVLDYTEK